MSSGEISSFLTMSRELRATPERLFEVWTGPDHIKRWFGGAETAVDLVEVDLEIGGRYLIRMPGEGGPTEVRGQFLEIDPPHRLVYTWRMRGPQLETDETTVTVMFRSEGDKTTVELRHGPFSDPGLRQLHSEGWTACIHEMGQMLGG